MLFVRYQLKAIDLRTNSTSLAHPANLPSVISFFFKDYFETNYPKIYWTYFHNLFHQMVSISLKMIKLF